MSANPIPCGELSRALIIKLRHHGDVLLASPVFSALKHAAPQCEIDALVYDETEPMLAGHPAIAQIHCIGRRWRRLNAFARLRQEWRLFSRLRQRRYDLIVHLTDSWRGAWLTRGLRPAYSVAPCDRRMLPSFLWRSAFTHLAPLPQTVRHTVEQHLDVLRRLGIQVPQQVRTLFFAPDHAAEQRIRNSLAEHGLTRKGFIHVHPTSRWLFKAWTEAGYAETISALGDRGLRVVMTAGPDAREVAMAERIAARSHPAPLNLAGQLTLKELGAVIAAARLSICVDSVPMHIAAAAGTPVTALFGPSDEREWGPWRVPHRVVTTPPSCRPCRLDGCGGGKVAECLTDLTTAEVLAAVDALLAETA